MKLIINIKFCFRWGKTATKISKCSNKFTGSIIHSRTSERVSHFRGGGVNIEHDEHIGQPNSMRMTETIEKTREFVISNRLFPLRVLANEVNIFKKAVRKILTQDIREHNSKMSKLSRKRWRKHSTEVHCGVRSYLKAY